MKELAAARIPAKVSDLREVQIEITGLCNADCPFCINRATFAATGRTTSGLPTDVLRRVIDWIADAGISRVRFTGGEPLVRKDIFELVADAKKRNLFTVVNTNGYLVDRHVQQLMELVDIVLLSIISTKPERTDSVMAAPGSHSAKIRALYLLRNHPGLWTSTVINQDSVDELEDLYELMRDNAVKNWILLRPESNGQSNTGYDLDEQILITLVNKAREIERKYGELIGIGNAVPVCAYEPQYLSRMVDKADGAFVSEGRSKLVVDPYGQVLVHYGIGRPIGFILDDLQELWDADFARRLRSIDILPELCKSCRYLSACHGGSRIAARAKYGSFEQPDPLMRPENAT